MSNNRYAVDRKTRSRRSTYRHSVGKVLPREKLSSDDVATGQAEVLQACFGKLKSPAKEMALETGLNERACRNQIAGLNCMNLTDFFNACRSIPELQDWGLEMMGAIKRGDQSRIGQLMSGHRAITLRIDTDGISVSGEAEDE